jgi:hypothetical protein
MKSHIAAMKSHRDVDYAASTRHNSSPPCAPVADSSCEGSALLACMMRQCEMFNMLPCQWCMQAPRWLGSSSYEEVFFLLPFLKVREAGNIAAASTQSVQRHSCIWQGPRGGVVWCGVVWCGVGAGSDVFVHHTGNL